MPIDAQIPLQTQTPAPPNQIGQAMQAYTLKSAMMQSQAVEQGMKDQAALKQVFADPNAFDTDPASGVSIPKPETMQKLYQISPSAAQKLGEATMKMRGEQQQQQQRKQQMQKAYVEQAGPPTAALATEYETLSKSVGPEKAWEQVKPKADALHQQMLPMAQQAGVQANGFDSPDKLISEAGHWSKYAEQKLKATQPKTPHELAMEGRPQSAEGKVVADVQGGKLSEAQGKKALDKKDRININMSGGGLLDEETKAYMAQQYLSGDKSVLTGLARNGPAMAAMRTEIVKQAKMMGMKPAEVSAKIAEFTGMQAGERTLGQRTANIEMAGTEAAKLADLALKASGDVTRTGIKSINTAFQAVQKGTASPELRAFVAANTSLINAYARAINPQGVGTVADKEHARDMLEVSFSKGDYKSAVNQLLKEISAARASPGSVKTEMRQQFTGKSEGGAGKKWVFDPASGTLKPQ